MFEEFMGLPAHPLMVHAAVVLVPLLAAAGVAHAVLVPWRRRIDWAVVLLAIAAPAAVYAARESGKAFQARLAARDQMPPERAALVDSHAELSGTLIWLTLALAVAALALVVADRMLDRAHPVRTDEEAEPGAHARSGGTLRLAVTVLLAVAVIGFAGAAGWYVFQTGDSGSRMVWEGS